MHARSFIIGLICGAVVGVAAGLFLIEERVEVVTTDADHEVNSTVILDAVKVSPTTSNRTEELAGTDDQEANDRQTLIEASNDTVAPWPANLRAELEQEPKDDSWAYYMEQTLLQFLSAHSSIDQFDISSIECRMTKCQIEVFGYDESTVPVWQQVMYDIQQQPWSEFGQYGSSSGTVDGRLTIVGVLHRKSESE